MGQDAEVNEPRVKLRGGLPIFKPAGISSFDVIRRLRSIVPKGTRMGHSGTLDPAARGLLLVLLNEATRVQHLLADLRKEYVAEVMLGVATDTGDQEGRITEQVEVPEITSAKIEEVLAALKGTRMQRPPQYSALKVEGQRAYKRARAGEEFELPEREVTVYNLELSGWESPLMKVSAEVSAGTYIRSLAREIGEGLGLPASLESLVRTRVGDLCADDALLLDKLDLVTINKAMIPIHLLLSHLPQGQVGDAESLMLLQGKPVEEGAPSDLLAAPLSLVFSHDRLRAFLCVCRDGSLRSKRLLYNNGGADG